MVDDIHKTYGVRVGIIDLETLLNAAVQKVQAESQMDFTQFRQTIGFLAIETA